MSAFRSLLFVLAGNGTYYAAHAADVVARAAIAHKPLSSDNMVKTIRPQEHVYEGTPGQIVLVATALFKPSH